jgi:deoxyadenosine/deoxycytidine kinase
MLYNDPHRWGFTFQSNAQLTLSKLHAQPAKAAVKVMERSIYSARYCFTENLYRKYRFLFSIKFFNLIFIF